MATTVDSDAHRPRHAFRRQWRAEDRRAGAFRRLKTEIAKPNFGIRIEGDAVTGTAADAIITPPTTYRGIVDRVDRVVA